MPTTRKKNVVKFTRLLTATRQANEMLVPVADVKEMIEVRNGMAFRNDQGSWQTRASITMKDGTVFSADETIAQLEANANG